MLVQKLGILLENQEEVQEGWEGEPWEPLLESLAALILVWVALPVGLGSVAWEAESVVWAQESGTKQV